jgi:hypothetical protein
VPVRNTDGSTLGDISGYRIVYGTSSTNLSQSTDVAGAATTSRVISGLTRGATYFFAVMTLNSSGVASNPSGVASGIVQ